MQKYQRKLENLNHLAVFEASARLLSFTKAAQELGTSQPAVSQSIRRLEQSIGVRLFHRNHRIITLTVAGEFLKSDVSRGLTQIFHSIEMLQKQKQSKHVTLSVSSAFAHYWMIPRLQNFHRSNPNIDLRLQQTDIELDLSHEGISLGVWRGMGAWRGYDAALLAQESIAVLASPNWVQKHGPIPTLSSLNQKQLITLEEPHRYRPTWVEFFASFGAHYKDVGGGLRLNDYSMVLQAGIAGEGPILGWEHVTRHLVDAGLLVQIGDWRWNSGQGFYLVWPDATELTPDAVATRNWIIDMKNWQKERI